MRGGAVLLSRVMPALGLGVAATGRACGQRGLREHSGYPLDKNSGPLLGVRWFSSIQIAEQHE
jgi:hypothetical protein